MHSRPKFILIGLTALGLSLTGVGVWWLNRPSVGRPAQVPTQPLGPVAPLVPKEAPKRQAALEHLATTGQGLDKARARFLLASDLLERGQGQVALTWLNNLDREFPLLAPQVLVQKAQAHESQGNTEAANQLWQQILRHYAQDGAAAEALYALGRQHPRYWQQALRQFPAHPRTVALAQEQLRKDPNNRDLLLLLARHGTHLPDLIPYLDRLVQHHSPRLSPADWEALGFAYWEKQDYGPAGRAYAQAASTPETLYRAARGHQLGNDPTTALRLYQALVRQFPDSAQATLGRYRLALLPQGDPDRNHLEALAESDPKRAAQVLAQRLEDAQKAGRPAEVAQLRNTLLSTYSQTDSAAELRWQLAQQAAGRREWRQALYLAQAILDTNPRSPWAPAAGFWLGEWAQRLNLTQRARASYQQVLASYPESYYAWRSAVRLGWPVGDFTALVNAQPVPTLPPASLVLPSGSPTLRELYRLGQYHLAWQQWQLDFTQRQTPSLADQATDGFVRVRVGETLDGLFMLSSLADRIQTPADEDLYRQLQQAPGYWKTLYPLAYWSETEAAAGRKGVNPLLTLALIRQESRFQPAIRSSAGAVGLMQVLPETGDWIAGKLGIPSFRLDFPPDNLRAGTWYLDYTHSLHGNNSALALASYNAGPGNVEAWLQQRTWTNWDEFVEQIPFPETQHYVRAVLGNYWNYLRLYRADICERANPHLCAAAHGDDPGIETLPPS